MDADGASWNEIGWLVLALVARQSPIVQVFAASGTAFCVLMFVEGLRASFLPQGMRERAGDASPSRAHDGSPRRAMDFSNPTARTSARSSQAPRAASPCKTRRAPSPFRAPRPTIRRIALLPKPAEEAALEAELPNRQE
jgi:hypothetical protein